MYSPRYKNSIVILGQTDGLVLYMTAANSSRTELFYTNLLAVLVLFLHLSTILFLPAPDHPMLPPVAFKLACGIPGMGFRYLGSYLHKVSTWDRYPFVSEISLAF